jgi:hypothetical protein
MRAIINEKALGMEYYSEVSSSTPPCKFGIKISPEVM